MKYHYKSTQLMSSFLSIACFVLFVAYSISMYLDHQSTIVPLSYYIQSGSPSISTPYTAYESLVSALLGTLLCIIPAAVLLRCLHFPLRLKALAFLPSYVVLGLITGISPSGVASVENEIPIFSSIALLVLSVVLIFLGQLYHEDRGEHAPMPNYLGSNIFLSCLGMLFCLMLTNTDRHLHVQLNLAEAIHRNDYAKVDKLPSGETTTNNTITSIQVLSLCKQGLLADKLFSLRHLNSSGSLLPEATPSSKVFHTPTLVYNQLQAVPVGVCTNVKSFLEKALQRRMEFLSDTSSTAADTLRARPLVDYYLCALLLDREVKHFTAELSKYYQMDTELPKHYREALSLYHNVDSLSEPLVHDVEMDSIYCDYLNTMEELSGNLSLQHKICNRDFPNTYWNYYFFGNRK